MISRHVTKCRSLLFGLLGSAVLAVGVLALSPTASADNDGHLYAIPWTLKNLPLTGWEYDELEEYADLDGHEDDSNPIEPKVGTAGQDDNTRVMACAILHLAWVGDIPTSRSADYKQAAIDNHAIPSESEVSQPERSPNATSAPANPVPRLIPTASATPRDVDSLPSCPWGV